VQGGFGTCFCRHGTIFIRITSVAVQTISEPEIYQGAGAKAKTLTTCPSFCQKSGKQLTFIVRMHRAFFINRLLNCCYNSFIQLFYKSSLLTMIKSYDLLLNCSGVPKAYLAVHQ